MDGNSEWEPGILDGGFDLHAVGCGLWVCWDFVLVRNESIR